MIGKLTGTYAGRSGEGAILIDVNGVGYLVRISASSGLTLKENAKVSFFIQTVVREDVLDLYGFTTAEELSFFKLLTSVSGVGPKTALGILNVADVQSLRRAVAQGDASALTKVYGIGKKSAERIVVELRDKLMSEVEERSDMSAVGSDTEVIEALMALGYRADESRAALRHVGKVEGVRERLSLALKHLGRS